MRETYTKQSGSAYLIATMRHGSQSGVFILLVAADFTALYLLGDKAELVELISNFIGVVIGVLLNPRDSVIAFSSVQPISLKHEGYVQFNINLLR